MISVSLVAWLRPSAIGAVTSRTGSPGEHHPSLGHRMHLTGEP